jgi:protein O-mannosyl-transferase
MKTATAIPRSGWRRLLFFIAGALVLVVVARIYSPHTTERIDYVWDDHALVEKTSSWTSQNASLRDVFLRPLWRNDSAERSTPYYRPIVVLSYQWDRALDRGIPAQNRATNLLLHLAACAFLALLAKRLGASPTASVLASLVWGLEPRLAESVAWISGRTDVLACTFGLASLLVMPAPAARARQRWIEIVRAIFAGILLFFALASKEVAIAFVFASVAPYLLLRSLRRQTTTLRLVLPAAIIPTIVYFVLRSIALGSPTGGSTGRSLGLGLRVATALEAVGRYAEMIVDPFHPAASIGYVGEPDVLRVAVGSIVLIFAVAVLYLRRPRTPAAITVVVLFAVSLGIVVQILPLNLSGSVTADRLLYIPLAALALLAAVLAKEIETMRSPSWLRLVVAGSAFALAVAESLRTETRTDDFLNDTRFWVTTAEHAHPHNTMPVSALGAVLREDRDLDRACALLTISHHHLTSSTNASMPARARTTENLASCWGLIGRYDEALALVEERAREQPNVARVLMALGFARLHVLDVDGAENAFRRAYELEKGQPAAEPSLQRSIESALAQFSEIRAELSAFQSDSRVLRGDIIRYARFLGRVGRLPEAQEAFQTIAVDPNAPLKVRADALEFLAIYAPYDVVVQTRSACENVPLDAHVRARLTIRHVSHNRVVPLLPRIDAVLARAR